MAKVDRKVRGAQPRSRHRAKALGVALGVAMVLTLGLLSLVSSSPDLTTQDDIGGHVTRHLRELLLDQSARGHAAALEAQGLQPNRPASMEAQGRRVTRKRGAMMETQGRHVSTTRGPAVAMEAQDTNTRVVGVTVTIPPTAAPDSATRSHPAVMAMEAQDTNTRVVGVTVTIPPTAAPDSATRSHPAAMAMEARLFRQEEHVNDDNWKPSSDTAADAEAKAK
ncbi:hypothetical protein PRIC1_003229 [Phytophthora ramorum]